MSRIVISALAGIVATASVVSIAAADPDGWAAWRVLAAGWPLGVVVAVLIFFFPIWDEYGDSQ